MRKGFGVAALGLCVLVAGCGGAAHGPLKLLAPQSTFDSAWTRDGQPCVYGACGYTVRRIKDLDVGVWFIKGHAHSVDVHFDANKYAGVYPSPARKAYWTFLTSFLPKAAHLKSCRTVTKTGGDSGPARACVYTYKGRDVLVAHYLTAKASDHVGQVAMDTGFDGIVAAKG